MTRLATAVLFIALATLPLAAWKNGGESTSIINPLFGTHDYIALQGLRRAAPAKVAWLKVQLNAYFIGTEAPDNGPKLAGVGGGYSDTAQCHCILFAANGDVANDRLEIRVREEFDKAKMALASGDKQKAAFYAGAMAHYLGDLSQFMHLMGKESHWGNEDQKLHAAYEAQVEQTITFQTRSSALLDPFMKKVSGVEGQPAEVALKVATFTEKGTNGMTPGKMYTRWQALVKAGNRDPEMWDAAFKNQTGLNVNVAANGIAGLLNDLP